MLRGALMQLLMRRQGRREKRQMYCDAHSAFNYGDGGGNGRGCKGGNKENKKRERKTERTHRPHQRWCTSWTASRCRSGSPSCQRKCISPVRVEKENNTYFMGICFILKGDIERFELHCLPGLVLHSDWTCEPWQVCLWAHRAYQCPKTNHKELSV